MSLSAYTRYVRSLVEHGERRIVEINWLFESVDRSLKSAQANLNEGKKSRGYVSLRHAKNLTGFLRRSLGDIPDQKLRGHLEEFFGYVDKAIETSMTAPIYGELQEMQALLSELHEGWLHLVAPIRGTKVHVPKESRVANSSEI